MNIAVLAKKLRRQMPVGMEYLDLVQAGYLGVEEARKSWDSSKASFNTYSENKARCEMLREMCRFDWIPEGFRRAVKRKSGMRPIGKRVPGQTRAHNPYYGKKLNREFDVSMVEAEASNEFRDDELARAVGVIPTHLGAVLRLYYWSGWSLMEIAEGLGVTESRVSQRHKEAIGKLRDIYACARA